MRIPVAIYGYIDVPDDWDEKDMYGNDRVGDITEYRYNEQLDKDDAINELARLLKQDSDDFTLVSYPLWEV